MVMMVVMMRSHPGFGFGDGGWGGGGDGGWGRVGGRGAGTGCGRGGHGVVVAGGQLCFELGGVAEIEWLVAALNLCLRHVVHSLVTGGGNGCIQHPKSSL